MARRSPLYADFARYQRALSAHNQYLLAVRRELDRKEKAKQDELDKTEKARRDELAKKEKARQDQLRTRLTWWKSLDGRSFEREVEQQFRKQGYQVRRTGRAGDEGVDLELRLGAKKIIVQCKAHRHYISPSVVRDLYGTLMHHRADEAWLVSTGGFFKGSRAFAEGKPIRLLTIKDLVKDADTTS
jgi:restriction system protein